ncbi:MAG: TetR/AcrR family transcriptional regulator [Pseudomonadota bacterium]
MATSTRKVQERTRATQQAILAAAFEEFSRVGFAGASLRQIADIAEVNHRLIQHHFGSKLDLWKATATHHIDEFEAHLARRMDGLAGVSEAQRLRLLFREFITYSASLPQLNKFMLHANDEPERMRWLVERLLAPSKHMLVNAIERAQALGICAQGDPKLLWFIFAGAATSIFAYHEEFEQVTGQSPQNEAMLEAHINTVINLFFPQEAKET